MNRELATQLRATTAPTPGDRPVSRKFTIPEEGAEHLARPKLARVANPTLQRLTVLKASAGFGKTALLAECCRGLAEQGVAIAWVSLDQGDGAGELDACIRAACDSAGLKLGAAAGRDESGRASTKGVEQVVHALETFAGPFVLAIDDVDLLCDRESVAMLNFLFNRGPGNLHMAVSCRELATELDVGSAYLDGSALVLDTEDLRFTALEITTLLGKRARTRDSKNDLAGWPIAVQIARNQKKAAAESGDALVDSVANWMDSRLLGRLAAEDRDLLLNIGQFEWMDADLLNDVLEVARSPRRVGNLPGMRGLLKPVADDARKLWRLHPLVRRHCVKRLFEEDPERFIEIHRRLAEVLARRGETASAMRHAAQTGATTLAGEILEKIGLANVHLRQGFTALTAVTGLLNEKILSEHPRLNLFRALSQALSGQLELARKNFSLVESMPGNRADEGASALDQHIVRSEIALCGGEPVGRDRVEEMRSNLQRLDAAAALDSFTLGHLQYRLVAGHQLAANFDAALDLAGRVREKFHPRDNLHTFIDLELGQIDMARGRDEDAEQRYSSVKQANPKLHPVMKQEKANARILLEELALERNRLAFRPHLRGAPRIMAMTARTFNAHAAASVIAIEMELRHQGADAALKTTTTLLEFFRNIIGSPPLVRYVAAQKTALLARAGRADEAAREWRLRELPEHPAQCLDLAARSWREMEALSCARLRLLTALREFDQARDFAASLCQLAAERGLKRTLMRALSLAVALERRAGDDRAAMRQLRRFLRLFAETPYALAMAQDHEINAPLVEACSDEISDSASKKHALRLLAAMRTPELSELPLMSAKELQVLEYIGTHQDKEIARILDLTPHGVRYHIRKIFAKLDVGIRADADRRARELGLLVGKINPGVDSR